MSTVLSSSFNFKFLIHSLISVSKTCASLGDSKNHSKDALVTVEDKSLGLIDLVNNETWKKSGALTVVVIGASGDLAK